MAMTHFHQFLVSGSLSTAIMAGQFPLKSGTKPFRVEIGELAYQVNHDDIKHNGKKWNISLHDKDGQYFLYYKGKTSKCWLNQDVEVLKASDFCKLVKLYPHAYVIKHIENHSYFVIQLLCILPISVWSVLTSIANIAGILGKRLGVSSAWVQRRSFVSVPNFLQEAGKAIWFSSILNLVVYMQKNIDHKAPFFKKAAFTFTLLTLTVLLYYCPIILCIKKAQDAILFAHTLLQGGLVYRILGCMAQARYFMPIFLQNILIFFARLRYMEIICGTVINIKKQLGVNETRIANTLLRPLGCDMPGFEGNLNKTAKGA